MVGHRHAGLTLVVQAALLIAPLAACTATPTGTQAPHTSPTASPAPTLPRGGTFRLVIPENDETLPFRDPPPEFLDPQQDFNLGTWELWRCCLTRTLLSHNGRSVEQGGARLLPDLAESLPAVSADGLTWTFRLKQGLRYGPPLEDVEITAADFVRSFHRLFSPALQATGIWFDFTDIEGALEYQSGQAASISGLEAPDRHTLAIRLTNAIGDFGARLAEPMAAPIPPHPIEAGAPFGAAEGADVGYGRFLVSSGPYMLEGSEDIDFSVPAAERTPASGAAAGRVVVVRNPSWDPRNDPLRPAKVDRIELFFVASMEDALDALESGDAEMLYNARTPPQVPPDVYAAYQADPTKGQLFAHAAGAPRGLILNVAVPPFDDIHVRKALNLVIDKQALVDLQGGPSAAEVYGHLAPDSVEDGLLLGYDPYARPPFRGDLDAARTEMAQSRYDTDGDGRCDVPACQQVRAATRQAFAPVALRARDDFTALGVELDVDVVDRDTFFGSFADARTKIGIYLGIGWVSSYIGASNWFVPFSGRLYITDEHGNGTLVGATPEQLTAWGYTTTDVPNVDARVDACLPLIGAAQFQCWASLDQYLMEEVVPWVPYSVDRVATILSPRVTGYSFDELMLHVALDQVALKP